MPDEPIYGDVRLVEAVRRLRWLARQGPSAIQQSIDLLDEAGIFDRIDRTIGVRLGPKDTCTSCPRADNIHASCPCEDEEPCRCGHSKGDHSSIFADPQCRLCPEDGEKMWRHPYTPESVLCFCGNYAGTHPFPGCTAPDDEEGKT